MYRDSRYRQVYGGSRYLQVRRWQVPTGTEVAGTYRYGGIRHIQVQRDQAHTSTEVSVIPVRTGRYIQVRAGMKVAGTRT